MAQSNTGVFYREGQGCEQNYKRAAEWQEKAVLGGNPDAMAELGILCFAGKGVPQSCERAVKLFKQAAAQGILVRKRDQAQTYTK